VTGWLESVVRRVRGRRRPPGGAEMTTITAYPDGPLLVRGPFVIQTRDGTAIDPGRRTVALCRCGKSATKPFCDGTHKVTGFKTPV
jgi:hypothetical protein